MVDKRESIGNLCTNVFKDGKMTTSKEAYTRKWIELINKMEKDRCHTVMKN